MRKYNNPRLLNTVVAGPGMKHPTKPHVIVGDNGEFIQGDLMDANAVGELVDQKIDDSEEHIIPKIDELSEQLEQEITNREAADEDLSETIDSRIQDVVGAAPEALDTLKELADALNDDANFAATVTNELTELDERVDNNTSGISSLNTRVESLETSTPDWNENDPTSPSYIKNRTHYEESGPGVIYGEIEGTETIVQFVTQYYSTDYTAAQYGLVVGKKYHVTIYRDGEERIAGYYIAASYPNGIVALSNAGYTTYPGYGNTIVPNDWGVRYLSSSSNIRFDSKTNYGTVRVIISDNDPGGTTVKTLDKKFIPATIEVEHISTVKDITFDNSATLTTGNGAVASGTGAIWAENFGVSGDLLFSGRSSVQKRFGSGALPVITFTQEFNTGNRVWTDIMSLGKDKALSVIDHFKNDNPLQPYGTPEVRVSGNLNISEKIYVGKPYNTISGNFGGIAINGVNVNLSGSISEVATLSFKSGGTLAPSINGVQDIFGKNNVHISMSGSTTGDGIDFGNAPLKNVNGIQLAGTGTVFIGSGTLNVSGGTLNVSGAEINASGALLKMSNASITGNINATGASLSGVAINNGIFSGSTQMGPVLISGSIEAPYQTLTVRSITGVSGGINMDGGSISGASSISGAGGAVNIGFSGYTGYGKLDMISGVLETSGVMLKSGGTLTFGDGTTMNTASANLDDADNVIGGKELKIYYGTGGASMSPFSYNNSRTELYIERVSTDEVFCNSSIICSTVSGTLRGIIENTTFNSGNTFSTGFVDELKTALGIS